jgi:tetratricopeptide (TPR) repeat protein
MNANSQSYLGVTSPWLKSPQICRWALMLNLMEPLEDSPQQILEKIKEPQTSDEFYLVGIALEQLGKMPHAEQMFRRALEKNMAHVPSMYGLALKAFQMNNEKVGKRWLARAIRIDHEAENHVLRFQRELKTAIPAYQNACRARVHCLKELENFHKQGIESRFELAKLHFEMSNFNTAIPYLRKLLGERRYSQEAAEYLSFALENLYKGNELLEKNLEIAAEVKNRADLFFNLAMVCQHDQRRMDLALHFFYLASEEEPDDPGLRFSLEQAALEVITEGKRRKLSDVLLMFAHLYQGSTGVAKKYASDLKEYGTELLSAHIPERLWKEWILPNRGPLGRFLAAHFKAKTIAKF